MCPPCVGGSYCPDRACTSHGTCSMDHRARNALDTSRRTRGRSCPWRQRTSAANRARQTAARPITRTHCETTQSATPTQRPKPGQKRKPTSSFRTLHQKKRNLPKIFRAALSGGSCSCLFSSLSPSLPPPSQKKLRGGGLSENKK